MKEINDKIIIYNAEDGQTKIAVRLEDDTIWLSQKQMSELLDCTLENVIFHLKNVYDSGELREEATTKDYLVVQKEGNRSVKREIISPFSFLLSPYFLLHPYSPFILSITNPFSSLRVFMVALMARHLSGWISSRNSV